MKTDRDLIYYISEILEHQNNGPKINLFVPSPGGNPFKGQGVFINRGR